MINFNFFFYRGRGAYCTGKLCTRILRFEELKSKKNDCTHIQIKIVSHYHILNNNIIIIINLN